MSQLNWIEYSPCDQPKVLMILLHGRGTTGHDLYPLAEALDLPEVRFILPTAPLPLDPGAYQWYDFNHSQEQIPPHGVLIQELLAALRQQSGPLPVVLLGFSQGAVMTLEAGLTLKPTPLALVALSGYLFRLPALTAPLPPILIIHGDQDRVIPVQAGRNSSQSLQNQGLTVTYREFPLGHGISLEVVAAVREFLLPYVDLARNKDNACEK